uniref:Uncharacterized protein n=1 Tax=Rhizophora mucronata TaxID=61149 RepID=A0A2P2J032_RHIMU
MCAWCTSAPPPSHVPTESHSLKSPNECAVGQCRQNIREGRLKGLHFFKFCCLALWLG